MNTNKIRGIRLVAASVALLFIIFVIFRIYFEESKKFSPLFIKSPTVIFSIWIFIIVCALIFLFVLTRNLVKLYDKKHRERVGSKLKNRLVFSFIAISIVPTLLLFFFATDIISRAVDFWFQAPIQNIMDNVKNVEASYYDKVKQDLAHFSNMIAGMIRQKSMYREDNHIFLLNRLNEKMTEYKLDVINIYRNQKELISILNPRIPMQEYYDLPLDIIYKGLSGDIFIKADTLKQGELIRCGVSFEVESGNKFMVVTGIYFPQSYISSLKKLSAIITNYSQQKTLKDPVKSTYILLFIFITILIIFSASWLGFYLARGITIPIEKLVDATAEIARGNLDYAIDYSAKDEFSVLVNGFNHMALDLKENRDKLNRRTLELRHRRSIHETILKHITSGVIALNTRGEIIDINPEAARMLSLDPRDILKKHYSHIFAEQIYKGIFDVIDRAFNARFKLIEKEVDVKLQGKITNLALKITQIRNPINNQFAGLLVVFTELTQLIKAQRMLVWREVAKRIAHEIKNPLTPIQISTQRIMRSLDQPHDKFRGIVEDSLNIITQELESIKKLADEFSNYARLPEIKFTQGDINQILEKLISVYSSIYSTMQFQVSLDVGVPAIIKLDPEQIKRVFVNIIDNAIHACGNECHLSLTTHFNQENRFITIEIADNGPGISDEDKQKLFLPYFSKNPNGTGLGLAIVHNIVEEHNGLITVLDNQPTGARFVIELPA